MVARARIALGTLVEVALPATCALEERFEAAFAAIEHVHRRMSPRDPASDLARIASGAHRSAITVDPETHAVLALALEMSAMSNGAFDPTVGRRGGGLRALSLEPGCRVRTSHPVSLDLGGIAKGHAVDCAIKAAGGDLRVLGNARWQRVRVRHPAHPARLLDLCDLRGAALATSGAHFGSAFIDSRTRRSLRVHESISVMAPRCAVADALTKVVAFAPEDAPRILGHYGAEAFVVGAGLGAYRAGGTHPAHLRLVA